MDNQETQQQDKPKVGRPSDYTPELGLRICELIASGMSLKRICERDDMPHRSNVHRWLIDDTKKEFRDKYEESVNTRTENMFDELNEIADEQSNDWIEKKDGGVILNKEAVMRSRLRVDTRKWYLSKIMPKKYGDKLDLTSGGKRIKNPAPVTNFIAMDEYLKNQSAKNNTPNSPAS